MKHGIRQRELGRNKDHRKALFRNLLSALFIHGRITTTAAKAKELQIKAEKLITLAKRAQELEGGDYLHSYRRALSAIPDRKIVKKLFSDIAGRFDRRNGGYTRIIRYGGSRWEAAGHGYASFNRLGDNAPRVIIELIEVKEQDQELYSAGRGKTARQESEAARESKKKEAK